jgi:hypothetical protein
MQRRRDSGDSDCRAYWLSDALDPHPMSQHSGSRRMPSEPACRALTGVGLLMTMGGPADRRKDRPPASQVARVFSLPISLPRWASEGPARSPGRGWLPLECPPGANTTTPIGTSHHHQEPEANSGRGEGTASRRLRVHRASLAPGRRRRPSRNPSSSWRAPPPSVLSGMLGPS